MKTSGAKGDSYYGKRAERYEVRRKKQDWWNVEQEEMKSLLGSLPRNISVVDIPFGTGRFVPFYVENGYEISGLDASDAMLATASNILGDQFEKCSVKTGSAMELPFADGQFDLLVSTRFIRDIIVASDAMRALAEFSRVTKKYAIIQLGETTKQKSTSVDPEVTLGSRLTAERNAAMLKDVGFHVLEKRLVKSDPDEESEIYHFLCEKT